MHELLLSLKVTVIAGCDREPSLSCTKMLHQQGFVALGLNPPCMFARGCATVAIRTYARLYSKGKAPYEP